MTWLTQWVISWQMLAVWLLLIVEVGFVASVVGRKHDAADRGEVVKKRTWKQRISTFWGGVTGGIPYDPHRAPWTTVNPSELSALDVTVGDETCFGVIRGGTRSTGGK